MAQPVKVVFRSDVRGIAQAGDVKSVSAGYARNFLFPRKLAFQAAGPGALKQWETERQGTLTKATRLREGKQSIAQQIEAVTVTITAKASAEGRLFGSVGRAEIREALAKGRRDAGSPRHRAARTAQADWTRVRPGASRQRSADSA